MRNTRRKRGDAAAYLKALSRTARFHLLDACGAVRPLKLRIGLTNRCNSRCIMCNVWQQVDNNAEWLERELRVEEFENIFAANERFFSRLNHISLTGGEPTMRRDFVEIVQTIHRRFPGTNISFNSNGFATHRIVGFVESVLAFHPRLTVMISLDGFGEVHDRVRGVNGVFPRVMETLEQVLALRPANPLLKVELNYVMTPINADECGKIYDYCREKKICFNPIYCVQGELYFNESADNVSLTDEARRKYIDQFSHLLEEDDSLQTREIMDQLLDRPRDFDCWAGRIVFLIEENGEVYPNGGCPGSFVLGNLRDYGYSFERLLSGEQAQRVLARTKPCRLCRLSCETMATLRHPEALDGYRKSREDPPAPPTSG